MTTTDEQPLTLVLYCQDPDCPDPVETCRGILGTGTSHVAHATRWHQDRGHLYAVAPSTDPEHPQRPAWIPAEVRCATCVHAHEGDGGELRDALGCALMPCEGSSGYCRTTPAVSPDFACACWTPKIAT